MADAQIWAPDVGAGETVYTVGGTVEFTLKTVNADFTDNGAASAWLPGVLIVSDAGHVIARAVDQAVQVQAGSDASVSFFPGVKHAAAAAAAAGTPWALLDSTAGEALARSSSFTFSFAGANFNTSDPAVFSLRPFSPPFQGIAFLATGVYYVSWFVEAITNGTAVPAPTSTMLTISPQVSATDTFENDVDLARADDYGRIIQGTSPNVNKWDVRYVGLVGVSSVTGQRYTTLGAQNRSTTFDFPSTSGQGLYGRIFVARLSESLTNYSTFF